MHEIHTWPGAGDSINFFNDSTLPKKLLTGILGLITEEQHITFIHIQTELEIPDH